MITMNVADKSARVPSQGVQCSQEVSTPIGTGDGDNDGVSIDVGA